MIPEKSTGDSLCGYFEVNGIGPFSFLPGVIPGVVCEGEAGGAKNGVLGPDVVPGCAAGVYDGEAGLIPGCKSGLFGTPADKDAPGTGCVVPYPAGSSGLLFGLATGMDEGDHVDGAVFAE
ncbi:MAG: hypothetical protein Q4G59_06020, partial [Planctomycetia bacterium]|nr:hypothetical protein [Planctomycetia bacterium]